MKGILEYIMQDSGRRKEFGLRLKQLRKNKGWSQKELANMVGVSFQQLNKYEGALNTPPLEKVVSLSQALTTSIDFLVFGKASHDTPINDLRLLKMFQQLDDFDGDEREMVIKLIDALIVKNKIKAMAE